MIYKSNNSAEMDASTSRLLQKSDLGTNETNIKLDKHEDLLHAFWLILTKMGVTNEQLNDALSEVMEQKAKGVVSLKGMACPQCGSKAQFNGPFKIKCIYCGTEAILNPYEARELAEQANAVMEEQKAIEEQQKRWEEAQKNNPYQPYDVSKDLNFDDLM